MKVIQDTKKSVIAQKIHLKDDIWHSEKNYFYLENPFQRVNLEVKTERLRLGYNEVDKLLLEYLLNLLKEKYPKLLNQYFKKMPQKLPRNSEIKIFGLI